MKAPTRRFFLFVNLLNGGAQNPVANGKNTQECGPNGSFVWDVLSEQGRRHLGRSGLQRCQIAVPVHQRDPGDIGPLTDLIDQRAVGQN